MNWKTSLVVLGTAFAALTVTSQASAQDNDAMMKRGKMLWLNRGCAACHGIGKKNAGPDLAGVEMRRSKEWLTKWLKETDAMLASDSTAIAMMNEWNGQRMPKQNMSDADIEAILSFMRAEEAKLRK